MDSKIKPVQLDLFARGKAEETRREDFRDRFSSKIILSWENLVVGVIFITLSFLLFFSLGVERGKRQVGMDPELGDSNLKQATAAPQPAPVTSIANSANIQLARNFVPKVTPRKSDVDFTKVGQSSPTSQIKVLQVVSVTDENTPAIKKYTIQVATFGKDDFARQEEGRLKGQGYQTIIKSSGQWRVLCVGSFSDKQEAEATLRKLKSKYHDCYVRRL